MLNGIIKELRYPQILSRKETPSLGEICKLALLIHFKAGWIYYDPFSAQPDIHTDDRFIEKIWLMNYYFLYEVISIGAIAWENIFVCNLEYRMKCSDAGFSL